MKIEISEILKNERVADDIFRLVIAFRSEAIKPGQFFMLKTTDGSFFLPRPISVHTADAETVTFLYRIEGAGTKKIRTLGTGDGLQAFGPLGNGFETDFEVDIEGHFAIIGGGIGIAPLLFLAQKLGERANVFLGFKNSPYCVEDFETAVAGAGVSAGKVFVATEDGSHGHKGFVTDLIKYEDYSCIFSCGPEIMMKKISAQARNLQKIFVSLEKRMACGMGACLGCTIETKSGMKRVCKDGPIFAAEEIW